MPIPPPILSPDFETARLSHVELYVSDLAWSPAFYINTLGLQIAFEDAAALSLRTTEEGSHHFVTLRKGTGDEVGVLGFNLWDEGALEKAEAWLKARDLPTKWIDRPFNGRILRTRGPLGVPL